ncbi:MAG: hypothetical protein CVV25_14490 [Ignavibacteriae bacterium HGW-Ignavibacteriae-4]|nr:MAG: hypothetical protein CVV25_14490 [Ignavibacteriae bacterium HGW-Ignavibacteriae-4]
MTKKHGAPRIDSKRAQTRQKNMIGLPPWIGITKECEGNDPLRHGSLNLQGSCGECVSIMV